MVNINSVYQKVLTLLNKEQRGYLTPQEFNLLADRAQNEIFEIDNLNTHERNLVMLISKFSYYFKLALDKNEPHHLAEYCYNLSSSFNSFYSNNKIFSDDIDPQTKYKRMYIVKEFHETLINIFYCLGIEPVDKM